MNELALFAGAGGGMLGGHLLGCLTASLEIKENTSFSTDKNLELSVKAKLVEVGAQAGISNLETGEKTYFVKAEFAPVSHSA
ncbi:hypothetical protein ACIOWK_17275 [Pseudomonas protegens]|uniref:hypothetical protein n=1 Tax=Pseudomonas protegens TaxID=380021 RepID=UPI003158BA61